MWFTLSIMTLLGVGVVNQTLGRSAQELLYGPLLLVVYGLGALILGKKRDRMLLATTYFLTTIGFVMVYRLKPELAFKHLIWVCLGVVVMVITARLVKGYAWVERYKYLLGTSALALLLVTILFGREAGGAKAWLGVGPWQFQPVEIVKVLLVLFLSGYLQENVIPQSRGRWRLPLSWSAYGPVLVLLGLAVALLFLQRDLGAALLLISIFVALLYLATGQALLVAASFFLFCLLAFFSTKLYPHVQTRVMIWLDPWALKDTGGYQMVQAFYALASGGFTGRGLALGFPQFVPAVHTDFIFVAIAEELGLLGGAAVLAAFLFLVSRGWQMALEHEDRLGFLLVAGLVSIFAIQVLIIVGGTLGVIPLTGITLPFVSYGGSSLVSNYFVLGLIFALHSTGGARKV